MYKTTDTDCLPIWQISARYRLSVNHYVFSCISRYKVLHLFFKLLYNPIEQTVIFIRPSNVDIPRDFLYSFVCSQKANLVITFCSSRIQHLCEQIECRHLNDLRKRTTKVFDQVDETVWSCVLTSKNDVRWIKLLCVIVMACDINYCVVRDFMTCAR